MAGGAAVAAAVSERMADYEIVVATRDHHVDPGDHFSDTPDFVHSWPPHCRVGTPGAVQAVFSKGEHTAAYSGFEGTDPGGVTLRDWLVERRVDAVDVVGIATDHCVRATALDAVEAGFGTTVLLDLCAGVAPESTARALGELRAAGIEIS